MKIISSVLLFVAILAAGPASADPQLVIRVSLGQQTLTYRGVDAKGKTVSGQTRILPQRPNQDAVRRIPRGTFTLYTAGAA